MKPIRFSNLLAQSRTLRSFRLALAAPALVLTLTTAQAGTPATPTAPAPAAPASNWISFTIGGAFVDGDDAGMMSRTGTNGDFYGGIDSLHFAQELDKSTTLTIDGHAVPGLEDYEFSLLLNKEGLGYVKVEYDQFRTWYDASGGYTALSPTQYAVPFGDERSIDRGEFTFEAGLRMENVPEVTFRYVHAFRNGDKDSTCWGDPVATTVPAGSTTYKTIPSLWNIDETVDILELDVEHTLGLTDLGLGLVWEHAEQTNSRYTPRALNSISLVDASESDLFAAHISSVTRFNDKMWLSFAAAYDTMDSDLGGSSRTYNYAAGGPPVPPPATWRDYSYNNTNGGTNLQMFVANLNFMWEAMPDLTITPSLRFETEDVDTYSQFNAYGSNQGWFGAQSLSSLSEMDELSEALDIRYKGVENMVLYATCDWSQEDETVIRRDEIQTGEWLDTDIDTDDQKYTLGANWYPMNNLSFGIQGLYGLRDQSFDHTAASNNKAAVTNPGNANNLRPIMAEHNSETEDLNLRMTWRPMSNLSLVTRYDYVSTDYENRGIVLNPPAQSPGITAAPLGMIDSGSVESNILSESVTWSPLARMYVQGSVSWVWSETTTPVAATTPNVDNDYLTCGVNIGYAIDDRSDLRFGYNYYGTNNYAMAYTTPGSLGYGLETSEHAFNVTYSRALTDNMLWNVSYGYITSNTENADQSGGFNDFAAHMLSTGLQIRF